jgi:hypothetical protein
MKNQAEHAQKMPLHRNVSGLGFFNQVKFQNEVRSSRDSGK